MSGLEPSSWYGQVMALSTVVIVEPHSIVVWLLIGLVAGALAGRVVAGAGLGCFADTAIGLAGAVVGGLIFRLLGPSDVVLSLGFVGDIVVAFIGAVIVLGVVMALKPGSRSRWRQRR